MAFTWLRRVNADLDWHAIASSARLLAMTILVSLACCSASANGQKEPDVKRKAEIVVALNSHGFPAANWSEARLTMRQIAADHGWQTSHVPDARVLILLDLGNAHSNPWVATQRGSHLDRHDDQEDKP
jgi:hypothetical protein